MGAHWDQNRVLDPLKLTEPLCGCWDWTWFSERAVSIVLNGWVISSLCHHFLSGEKSHPCILFPSFLQCWGGNPGPPACLGESLAFSWAPPSSAVLQINAAEWYGTSCSSLSAHFWGRIAHLSLGWTQICGSPPASASWVLYYMCEPANLSVFSFL